MQYNTIFYIIFIILLVISLFLNHKYKNIIDTKLKCLKPIVVLIIIFTLIFSAINIFIAET